MPPEPTETNPYRSPSAADDPATPVGRPFPLRIIPVILLYLYGALTLVHSAIGLFLLLVGGAGVTFGSGHRASSAQLTAITIAAALTVLHACFAIAVGWLLWRRRWKRCAVAFAGVVVLLAAVVAAHGVASSMPPGDPWPRPETTSGQRPANSTVCPSSPKGSHNLAEGIALG